MHRWLPALITLCLVASCGSQKPGPVSPSPGTSPLTPGLRPSAVGIRSPSDTDSSLDSMLVAADSAAEGRLAADSAADEAVLEELATARPDGDVSDDSLADAGETSAGGANAVAGGVTWDIDVATFNSHDRVQYYLDFFQTRGRERMEIWLSRMPQYEAMVRERLQREGLPGDLVYLALIESGFSNTATSRAKAVGMWQFMKATAKLYGLRVDSWVDQRRDPYRATDAAVRHLSDLNRRFGSL